MIIIQSHALNKGREGLEGRKKMAKPNKSQNEKQTKTKLFCFFKNPITREIVWLSKSWLRAYSNNFWNVETFVELVGKDNFQSLAQNKPTRTNNAHIIREILTGAHRSTAHPEHRPQSTWWMTTLINRPAKSDLFRYWNSVFLGKSVREYRTCLKGVLARVPICHLLSHDSLRLLYC